VSAATFIFGFVKIDQKIKTFKGKIWNSISQVIRLIRKIFNIFFGIPFAIILLFIRFIRSFFIPRIKLDQILIDPTNNETQKLMKCIQGNILKGHGRNYSKHMFLQVTDKEIAKRYIATFASNHVTSAFNQYEQTLDFKSTGTDQLFCNIMFSSSGYEALGIPKKKHPNDSIWKKGMKYQGFLKVDIAKFLGFDIPIPLRNPLRDPPVDTWDDTFKQDIHVLILLASSDEEALIDTVIEIQKDIEQFGLHVIGVEDGRVIRNDKNQVIEHFGHPDGVSQPLFYTSDYAKFLKQQNIYNDKKQLAKYADPRAPLNLVLTKDPLGKGDYSFGSYMVYRKLEQDVIGYKKRVNELANSLEISEKLADQMVIGRDTDGVPLGILRTEPADGVVPDNFDFSQKSADLLKVCPFQAHIRKVNIISINPMFYLQIMVLIFLINRQIQEHQKVFLEFFMMEFHNKESEELQEGEFHLDQILKHWKKMSLKIQLDCYSCVQTQI